MASSANALQTYELLERVLLHLPLRDLLFAQRVCKAWQAVWQRSLNIQRALFLHPSSDVRIQCEHDIDNYDDVFDWATIQHAPLPQDPIVNPFMKRLICDDGEMTYMCHHGFISPTPSAHEKTFVGAVAEAFHRQGASWRDMLFLQPGAVEAVIFCGERNGTRGRENTFFVKVHNNMTLGELVDGIRKHWFNCPNCSVHGESENGEGAGAERFTEPYRSRWELRCYTRVQEVPVDISGRDMLERVTIVERSTEEVSSEQETLEESASI